MEKVFNTRILTRNTSNYLNEGDFRIKLYHIEGEPDSVNRLRVTSPAIEMELLPSKGLSLSQAWVNGKTLFWEAPIEIPDTETIDLYSDEVRINGKPMPGFTFLKTFVAGVELYGLRNWGMPDFREGMQHPLHGETSNIPVESITCTIEKDVCTISAVFIYRDMKPGAGNPWYLTGEPLFRVNRKVILFSNKAEIILEDTIGNISKHVLEPDWGYHITFRPEEGARLIVPSARKEERGGNPLPADIETWHKAADERQRTETGIIHKQIDSDSNGRVLSKLIYPDHSLIEVLTPQAPYFQTWFCNGGKGSGEFTDSKGNSLLKKNWDGMGIEIGSSALDHNGNTDESCIYNGALKPGEEKVIGIVIRLFGDPVI